MNHTNQLQGDSQHYKLYLEAKKYRQKVQDCVLNDFNEGKELQSHESLQMKMGKKYKTYTFFILFVCKICTKAYTIN